jgi:hypothetical protein
LSEKNLLKPICEKQFPVISPFFRSYLVVSDNIDGFGNRSVLIETVSPISLKGVSLLRIYSLSVGVGAANAMAPRKATRRRYARILVG